MKMPDLATTDSAIRIVRWMIEPGRNIQRGQSLVEVETDKATTEVESIFSGALVELRAAAGEQVSAGQVIAVFEVETPTAVQVAPPAHCSAADTPPSRDAARLMSPEARAPSQRSAGMFARNRAAAAAIAVAAPAASGVQLSVAQRVAARRLQESKQTVPHFYLQTSVNASRMIARREAAKPLKLAWDAFFVLAAARAIAKFDRFRCRLDGDRLTPLETDAIGVAVDEGNELFVLPVAAPTTKSVEQISAEIRQNVERLRSGDPQSRRIHPALLTISNLGVCNVEAFVPIINPPEAAILGVGRIAPTPVVKSDGSIAVEPRCTLTLSVDHRVTSGRYAGDFLTAIVEELESLQVSPRDFPREIEP